MDSYSYWSKREQAHAELQKASDEEVAKQMRANLEASKEEIESRINLFYERYAGSQGITLEEAMKRVSDHDVKAFEKKAKEYVKNKDFSDEANKELKLYNATMRINRLEMLKAEVDFELLKATEANGKLIEGQLKTTAYKEYERQAGILGENIPVNQRQVMKLISSSVSTAGEVKKPVWNQTLWTNQQEMANELNVIIRRAITQGVNVTTAIGRISDKFGAYKYNAKRLLVTETAYVQGLVQLDSFIAADFAKYVYLAEKTACEVCGALDGKVFTLDEMAVGKNFYPMHPGCKCSAAPYMDEKEFENFLKTGKAEKQKRSLNDLTEALEKVFTPAKTIKEANEFAVNKLGVIADYKGIDIQVANQWNEGLYNMKMAYPEVAENIKFVGSSQQRYKLMKDDLTKYFKEDLTERFGKTYPESAIDDAVKRQVNSLTKGFKTSASNMASSFTLPDEHKTKAFQDQHPFVKIIEKYEGITLNNKFYNNFDSALESGLSQVKAKWSPLGCETVKATFDHEFAHQMDNFLGVRNNKKIRDIFDTKSYNEIKEGLCEYAVRNSNRDRYAEMIAEGWSEYLNNENPREIATTVGTQIERMWADWKKR